MSRPSPLHRGAGDESGQTLLVVLIILIAVAASSTSFIWFMNQQQTRAGSRYRSAAALTVAQAGLARALAIIESTAPDGTPGRDWRPSAHTEALATGSIEGGYTIAVQDHPEWGLLVTSEGRAGAAVRRIQARVVPAPPALLAALYASASLRLVRPPAALAIAPYGAIAEQPWVGIAAGGEIWFASERVRLNDPAASPALPAGPLDPLGIIDRPEIRPPLPLLRVLLLKEAGVLLGEARREADADRLRAAGFAVAEVRRVPALPPLPEPAMELYARLAEENRANALLNRAAGRFAGDHDLERKEDSRYDAAQMARLITYLNAQSRDERLRGMIYVGGRVTVPPRERLEIADGTLVAENTVKVDEEGELRVTHTARSRFLPGVIVLDPGGLVLGRGARLFAHGLVDAAQLIDLAEEAVVDVVGAIAARASGLSLRNGGASIALRYDPAVLGTYGLRVSAKDPVVAWVAAWEESSP